MGSRQSSPRHTSNPNASSGPRCHITDPLTSLPPEILTMMAAYCNLPTARSFALVSRACTLPAKRRIWRTMHLSIRPDFPAYPAPEGPHAIRGSVHEVAAEETRKAATQAKIGAIYRIILGPPRVFFRSLIPLAESQEWRCVQRLTLVPKPQRLGAAIAILTRLSPHLRYLEFESPYRLGSALVTRNESLDFGLVRNISFPILTHVRLGHETLRFSGQPLSFDNAPNLVSFDIDVRQSSPSPIIVPRFGLFTGLGGLRQLRIVYHHDSVAELPVVASLLQRSPLVEQLALAPVYTGTQSAEGDPWRLRMLNAVEDAQHLRDLAIISNANLVDLLHSRQSMRRWRDKPARCPKLRRILDFRTSPGQEDNSEPPADPEPFAPHLEIIIGNIPVPSTTRRGPETLLQDWHQAAVTLFRAMPKARAMYSAPDIDASDLTVFLRMEDIENRGTPCTVIRSLRHRDSDLFYFRVQDAAGSWEDAGIWNGQVVPLHVMRRMREVEGASEADWDGRGVEVGDPAWQVLLDWKRALDTLGTGERGRARW